MAMSEDIFLYHKWVGGGGITGGVKAVLAASGQKPGVLYPSYNAQQASLLPTFTSSTERKIYPKYQQCQGYGDSAVRVSAICSSARCAAVAPTTHSCSPQGGPVCIPTLAFLFSNLVPWYSSPGRECSLMHPSEHCRFFKTHAALLLWICPQPP